MDKEEASQRVVNAAVRNNKKCSIQRIEYWSNQQFVSEAISHDWMDQRLPKELVSVIGHYLFLAPYRWHSFSDSDSESADHRFTDPLVARTAPSTGSLPACRYVWTDQTIGCGLARPSFAVSIHLPGTTVRVPRFGVGLGERLADCGVDIFPNLELTADTKMIQFREISAFDTLTPVPDPAYQITACTGDAGHASKSRCLALHKHKYLDWSVRWCITVAMSFELGAGDAGSGYAAEVRFWIDNKPLLVTSDYPADIPPGARHSARANHRLDTHCATGQQMTLRLTPGELHTFVPVCQSDADGVVFTIVPDWIPPPPFIGLTSSEPCGHA